MTDLNQTQIEIIASLKEYQATKEEMAIALRIGPAVAGKNQGHNTRAEAAQAKLDSIERSLPDRATIEGAVLAELQQLGAEYYAVKSAFQTALWEELAAVQKRDAANQTVQYQQRWSILGLDPIKAAHGARDAQEALNKAIYGREVIGNRLDQVHLRTGTNPDPAHFPAIAAARVDSLLGDVYARQHLAGVKEKFGLTDSMLSRMVT